MKLFFIIVSLGCALLSQAQEIKVETKYYNELNQLLEGSEGASYYTYDTIGDQYGSYAYYMTSNKLKSVTAPGDPKEARHKTHYYVNGAKQAEGNIKNGTPVGKLSLWYSTGQNLAEAEFANEQSSGFLSDFKVINYWDSLGNQLVKDGEGSGDFKFPVFVDGGSGTFVGGQKHGIWKGTYLTGRYEEAYDHAKLVSGVTTLDGKTYNYTALEQPATFKDGVPGMFKVISKTMRYPASARRAGRQGSVFVEFVIEKDGTLTNPRVIKGFDRECEEEALRTVKALSSPPWNPGLQRGIPVRVRFVLPLKFVLG